MAHVKNLDLRKVPRVDYSRARMAVERAFSDLHVLRERMSAGMCITCSGGGRVYIASFSAELDIIRRYLDGE